MGRVFVITLTLAAVEKVFMSVGLVVKGRFALMFVRAGMGIQFPGAGVM